MQEFGKINEHHVHSVPVGLEKVHGFCSHGYQGSGTRSAETEQTHIYEGGTTSREQRYMTDDDDDDDDEDNFDGPEFAVSFADGSIGAGC